MKKLFFLSCLCLLGHSIFAMESDDSYNPAVIANIKPTTEAGRKAAKERAIRAQLEKAEEAAKVANEAVEEALRKADEANNRVIELKQQLINLD